MEWKVEVLFCIQHLSFNFTAEVFFPATLMVDLTMWFVCVNEMLAFHIMASHNMVNNLGMGVERLNTEQSRCALHTAEAWNVSMQLNLFPLRSTITMRKACSLWHSISRQEMRDSCRITGHPSCLNQIQYTSDNLKPTSSYIS